MSFLTAVQMLQKSLATVSQMMTVYLKFKIAGDRVFEFLSLAPGKTVSRNDSARIPHYKLLGNVKFENVDFAYASRPNDPVLQSLNLVKGSKTSCFSEIFDRSCLPFYRTLKFFDLKMYFCELSMMERRRSYTNICTKDFEDLNPLE